MYFLNLLLAASLLGSSTLADPSPASPRPPNTLRATGRPSRTASPEYSSGDSEVGHISSEDTSGDSGYDTDSENSALCKERGPNDPPSYYIRCGKSFQENVGAPKHCRRRGYAHCEGQRYVLLDSIPKAQQEECRRLCRCMAGIPAWMTTENGWQGTISGSRANQGKGKGKAA
ncbi:hypothetical protein PLIIFM63780_001772 [Purpureocillium lilacinum]|nr:hypothetical protein PLIIFM63780_001772 [Purpureocillium lilacinum]